MALQWSTTLRNTWLAAINTRFGAAATIEVRTGSKPANCAAADSGTLLGTLSFGNPAFSTESGGVMEENAIAADASADASGTPGHFRVKVSGACEMQGDAGVGSGDLSSTSAISAGAQITCSNFQLTSPGA